MINDTLFSELVEASRDIPGNRWSVGGNAAVMASRMATEGCDVLLGGSFSPDFIDVLSQHIIGKSTHALTDTNTHWCTLHDFYDLPFLIFLHLIIFLNSHLPFLSLQPILFVFPPFIPTLTHIGLSSGWQHSRRARHSSHPGVSFRYQLGPLFLT